MRRGIHHRGTSANAHKAWVTKRAKAFAASKREPQNYLEATALAAMTADPTLTLSVYANSLRLMPDSVHRLRKFLHPHLPDAQVFD